jgi:hypothetical protein
MPPHLENKRQCQDFSIIKKVTETVASYFKKQLVTSRSNFVTVTPPTTGFNIMEIDWEPVNRLLIYQGLVLCRVRVTMDHLLTGKDTSVTSS